MLFHLIKFSKVGGFSNWYWKEQLLEIQFNEIPVIQLWYHVNTWLDREMWLNLKMFYCQIVWERGYTAETGDNEDEKMRD